MQTMRNEGSGSSLTRWLWAGSGTLITQQTGSKQEEQQDEVCFQSFAKLPLGRLQVTVKCRLPPPSSSF